MQRAGQVMQSKKKYVDIKRRTGTHDSKLTYYVVIDLELYPGESIPLFKQPVIACHLRYEKIRQAFADMFGLLYQPLEFYQPGNVSPSAIKYDKDEKHDKDYMGENKNNIKSDKQKLHKKK